MASPFYLFRKYQKAFLVVAGVLAMFIFVVADPLMSWLQSSGGGGGARNAKTVVADWNGGSLNLQELDMLSQRRYKISEFLWKLVGSGAAVVEKEGGTPELPTSLPDFRLPRNTEPRSVQVGCVSTRILAEQAKESGITVNKNTINRYLREWGLRRMGDVEMGNILRNVGLSDKMLFAGLSELMMSNTYMSSYSLATRGIMPEERWQDWKRINERISLEAAILPAEKFLTEVPEPSETQLQQFYELHKDRIDGTPHLVMNTRLPSADPGFREPRRVKIQYLLGSLSDWTQKLTDKVSETEIADYYEQNKRTQFVKTSSSTSADGLFDEVEDEADSPAEETTDEPAEESPKEDATEETTEESPATTEEAAAADEDSGQSRRKSPFRLVALETETEEATAEGDNEEPLAFVPLEEVNQQIRRMLAREKATVELKKVVDRTYAGLQKAYNPYGFKVVSARTEEAEIPAPPAKLSDYKSLATETGLASEETVLLSGQELAGTFVGSAYEAQTGRQRVVQAMFSDQELYEPYRAIDPDGNSYIVCKVEDVASRVPAFDEVHDKVLTAWKKQEAAKLALAKAAELAKKAKESGDTVAVVARAESYNVVTTDMFSWLTFGTTQADMRRGPRLGEAPPLEAVDAEFMTQAFKLQPDEKIALLNHNQTNAYVVQLNRREQPEAEMQQRFLNEANNWYGGPVMNNVRGGAAQRQLIGQLSEQMGLNLDKLDEFLSKDRQ